ncbi:hypothetical protein E2C01_080854 [Portunus trituberculatus]|uniref:Uncharacterized protein n=1 Tax=Portunus trituberculatus TaxID=210409 RepID=A0A5B7IQF6_PORTR|nr:hypothetical protein [Portunus trituberculatus]
MEEGVLLSHLQQQVSGGCGRAAFTWPLHERPPAGLWVGVGYPDVSRAVAGQDRSCSQVGWPTHIRCSSTPSSLGGVKGVIAGGGGVPARPPASCCLLAPGVPAGCIGPWLSSRLGGTCLAMAGPAAARLTVPSAT